MKIGRLFLLCFALHTIAAAYDGRDDYNDLNFNFEMDFGEQTAKKAINRTADKGWRILGYDSNAFVSAKQSLKDPGQHIEILLAIVLIEKYPSSESLFDGVKMLKKEIKRGSMSGNFGSLAVIIDSMSESQRFQKVYSVMSELDIKERSQIATNLYYQLDLASAKEYYVSLSEDGLRSIAECIKPMLKRISNT